MYSETNRPMVTLVRVVGMQTDWIDEEKKTCSAYMYVGILAVMEREEDHNWGSK